METTCRNFSRAKKEIQTVMRECSNSMQSVWIIHQRHPMTSRQGQQTGTTNNGPLFQNLFDTHQPRTSTTMYTPLNSASPAPSANMTEALTQIIAQVANNSKKDDISKQMMKNIKIFDGTNKAECITWLSQIEAAASFSNTSFRELICQSMAP